MAMQRAEMLRVEIEIDQTSMTTGRAYLTLTSPDNKHKATEGFDHPMLALLSLHEYLEKTLTVAGLIYLSESKRRRDGKGDQEGDKPKAP